MSLAIAHFAIGVAGGFLILLLKPSLIPNFIRNDIFFVLTSGFWAMIPDLDMVFKNVKFLQNLDHNVLLNVFWFHPFVDKVDSGDTVVFAVWMIVAVIFFGYLYFKRVGGV